MCCLRKISVIIMTNLKLHTFLKTCWMSKGGRGVTKSDNDGQGGEGGV